MVIAFCGLLTAASSLVGCSRDASRETEASKTFNLYANRERYDEVYTMVDPALRSESDRRSMYRVLQHMHQKLGIEEDMTVRRLDMLHGASRGDLVRLVFDVRYSKGKGMEDFVWRRTTTGPVLEHFAVSDRN
jgi:hypothetical protein